MALKKQASYLTDRQVRNAVSRTGDYKHSIRNRVIVLLTVLAGLRAKEVAMLRWEHILNSDGQVGDEIRLTDDASKGKSGGSIPMNGELKEALLQLKKVSFDPDRRSSVIRSDKGGAFRVQSIVNLLWAHYRRCDIEGASSHSGRRTFITNVARKISLTGGSMRDVMSLARHKHLGTTQRYVEKNTQAQREVVKLL
jgi:integrase